MYIPYTRPYSPHPPGWEDPNWGVAIDGRDLKVGDVWVHLGRTHPITEIKPYVGGLSDVLGMPGEPARTACSGATEIAVGPAATIRILPREGP